MAILALCWADEERSPGASRACKLCVFVASGIAFYQSLHFPAEYTTKNKPEANTRSCKGKVLQTEEGRARKARGHSNEILKARFCLEG